MHVSLNVDNKYFYVKVEDFRNRNPGGVIRNIFLNGFTVWTNLIPREIGGTGLGLAITRSAVLMHHGAIKVYSKEGEGTTFTVRIPLKSCAVERMKQFREEKREVSAPACDDFSADRMRKSTAGRERIYSILCGYGWNTVNGKQLCSIGTDL